MARHAEAPPPRVRVWDLCVRTLHWSLVVALAGAWLAVWGFPRTHEAAGYAATAIVAARLFWGFTGSCYARFSQFVHGPRATLAYTARVLTHTEPRYIGHNPLGGWMALVLLACVLALGITGWLYTAVDAFWGEAWLDRLHAWLGWSLLGLAAVHVAGVVFTSLRHRENLLAAMMDGQKTAPQTADAA
ncbi:MAG: cytochrome b/b6 domain-containing protein [Ramlibacter sp.]